MGGAHISLAVLLSDKAATPDEFAEIESHLAAAKYDATTQTTATYVHGVLALRRGDGKNAVRLLRDAVLLDPNSDIVYYKLMMAETMQGNKSEAARALSVFQKRQRQKSEESDVLGAIALKPNRPDLYRRAVRYYETRKLPEQANAIRAEAVRRFGAASVVGR